MDIKIHQLKLQKHQQKMIKLLKNATIIFSMFFSSLLLAQVEIVLNSQSVVNEFDLDSLKGNILIDSDDILYLDSLRSLKYLDGNLTISNCNNLKNLSGLENIIFEKGTIRIENNAKLYDCCLLFSEIILNDSIIAIVQNNHQNCENIENVYGFCFNKIFPCGVSNLVDTFNNQVEIDQFNCNHYLGSIHIESDSIFDLSSLSILTKINGNLTIKNCTNLSNISLSNTLDSIGGTLNIINNPRLENINIEGNDSVQKISIINNDSLTQITLSNKNDSLVIEDNNQLEACCDIGINPFEDDISKVSISNNADGCNSLESLEWYCNKIFFPCGREGYIDTFNTTESINNFECNHYLGSIVFDYVQIENSQNFIAPKTILGNLSIINNNDIQDLFFLENLDSLKNLKIENCSKLKTISALKIKSIDTLILQNNNKLYACDEIINLIDTGVLNSNQIILDSNARSCNNLNQIQHYKGLKDYPCGQQEITDTLIYQFEIDSFKCENFLGGMLITDDQITNLKGLKNLSSVYHSLSLVSLNIDSIDTITLTITEKLLVRNNTRLKSIENINLREATNVIEISHNDSLTEINYLPFNDSLLIKNNKSLDNCCVIADNLFEETDKYVFIDSNNINCSGLTQIQNYCLETAFPCGILGVTDTFKENSDFDIDCYEYKGNMYVTGSNLNAIDSSNNIIYINGDLIIEEVNQPSLIGFEGLENIYGSLIFKNNSISNLKAFRNLYEIQNRLIVDANNGLKNSPIDVETYVRNITVTNNDSISFLYFGDGEINQNRLKSIEISGNQSLESIDGMFSEHMDSIKISNNYNLTSINAIAYTDTVYDILEITDNPKLSECCSMEPMLNGLSDTSITVINIDNNADSCNSVESILNKCQIFTSYNTAQYPTYDLKISQNNGSFIELSGTALEHSDKIYVIGVMGNIITSLPCNRLQKQTLTIENCPSGLYLIVASNGDSVLKAIKLFKK